MDAPVTKQLTEEQIADRNVYREVTKMSNRKMSRRVNRIARDSEHNIDAVWAIVLAQVFDNTKPQGKMEPFLR